MFTFTRHYSWIWLILFAFLLAACAEEEPTPVPTPLATAEIQPTAEATPTTRPTATPTATPLPPTVRISPQTVGEDGQIVVEQVQLPHAGWLAVYPASPNALTTADILGAVRLEAGMQANVLLTVDTNRITSNLQVALHAADAENLDPATAELLYITNLTVELALMRPEITAADQEVLEDGRLLIDGVLTNGNGWLTAENPDGTILGFMPVPNGETADLPLVIRWREATPDLIFALYQDADQNNSFDPSDPPLLYDGQPVTTTIHILLPPDIVVYDQPIVSGTLSIERIVSDGPAWVVVYQQDPSSGQPGLIIGSAALQDGLNENILVTLPPASLTDTLLLTLHDDVTEGDGFNFPASDPPRRYQERAFFTPVNTTVGNYFIVQDQPLAAENTIIIRWAVNTTPSWLVILSGGVEGTAVGEQIGRAWLPAGVNRHIEVTLDESAAPPATLTAALYQDNGTIQQFEPTTDLPQTRRGRDLAVPFTLTAE